jgi:hypothetical protein
VGIALADEATSTAIVALGFRFITFLLTSPARSATGFRPVGKLPLSFLGIDLHASPGHFSGAGWI